ncbi:MAG: DUF5993 family protein [Pseudomonadota bacterium]
MIALLFALLTLAMLLVLWNRSTLAYIVFGVTLVLSVYWLQFHATSQLTIHL